MRIGPLDWFSVCVTFTLWFSEGIAYWLLKYLADVEFKYLRETKTNHRVQSDLVIDILFRSSRYSISCTDVYSPKILSYFVICGIVNRNSIMCIHKTGIHKGFFSSRSTKIVLFLHLQNSHSDIVRAPIFCTCTIPIRGLILPLFCLHEVNGWRFQLNLKKIAS